MRTKVTDCGRLSRDLLEADSDRWSCAIFGTAAHLYGEQPAELDFVGLVESAVR
jgi:hypothetical protein